MGLRRLPGLPRCVAGVASLMAPSSYSRRASLADIAAFAGAAAVLCGVGYCALAVATAAGARGSSLYVEIAHAVCWVV